MRRVQWIDRKGRNHASVVRDRDPDDLAKAGYGIPGDPPDVDQLDWDAIKRDLHNELLARGIITYEDLVAAQNGATGAILAAIRSRLTTLYRQGG